ncbi:hypothetical protein WJX73_006947 [Symbiochloris irregularis]|uniref:Expansin n=1 Tax=Symbiochloris irregularis TaxID=706552 RepID=A0AAW1NX14_9CHLO
MSPYEPSFGTLNGGCGYGLLDKNTYPFWSVAALSTSNSFYKAGPANGCGECFEIQCINEGGPWAIGIPSKGNIDMRYRRVPCLPPANIKIDIGNNSCANGWLRIFVESVGNRGTVAVVQVKGQNSGWMAMTNTWGAAWELSNAPAPPLDVRVQDDDGSEVTAFGAISKNCQTGTVTTGVQFSESSSSSSSSGSSGNSSATDGAQQLLAAEKLGPVQSGVDAEQWLVQTDLRPVLTPALYSSSFFLPRDSSKLSGALVCVCAQAIIFKSTEPIDCLWSPFWYHRWESRGSHAQHVA